MNYLTLALCVFLASWRSEARVSIINAFRPLYVFYGGNLTLTCVSDQQRQLQWLREVPATQWAPQNIVPEKGGNIITRYLIEQPSGYVESTLIKSDVTLNDRGMYECHDEEQENSFALWVTVLYIQREETVVAQPKEEIDLFCTLSGFETNVPYIDYHWYFNEQEIVQLEGKYDLVHREGASELTIMNPSSKDGGAYTCSFTLQTNGDPVIFTSVITVDASSIPAESVAAKLRESMWLLAFFIGFVSLRVFLQ